MVFEVLNSRILAFKPSFTVGVRNHLSHFKHSIGLLHVRSRIIVSGNPSTVFHLIYLPPLTAMFSAVMEHFSFIKFKNISRMRFNRHQQQSTQSFYIILIGTISPRVG